MEGYEMENETMMSLLAELLGVGWELHRNTNRQRSSNEVPVPRWLGFSHLKLR